jgi:hypothetical protein
MHLLKLDEVNNKIITIRNENVILDSDVAALYGVETRRVNEAVKRNLDKFPDGYVFQLRANEFDNLLSLVENSQSFDNQDTVANCDRPLITSTLPKAFTERGLYMLATILKSPQATQTTIAIIDAFAKIREVSRSIVDLVHDQENIEKQQALMDRGGELLGIIVGDTIDKIDTETSYELNLASIFKIKHTVKRSKNSKKNK